MFSTYAPPGASEIVNFFASALLYLSYVELCVQPSLCRFLSKSVLSALLLICVSPLLLSEHALVHYLGGPCTRFLCPPRALV
ncbi:hypothetical protein cyc_05444 [Cyclospora cayetanensis]|uniref:Uncharacterized protein n=1 Tax=Cyclospora cayetanensis TaxID=88456 RepID=A0A1D3CXH6_9EIME|nr:hypothetical protein cyc_05444 [Cyclospora cayetanensis]